MQISIHAPPRGATPIIINNLIPAGLFQFTPLREGRPMTQATLYIGLNISIHAPPRGATGRDPAEKRQTMTFQFTPLREGRRCAGSHVRGRTYFNSRPSARGDDGDVERRGAVPHFNSRPSARGDGGAVYPRRKGNISIHAPPRGATRL